MAASANSAVLDADDRTLVIERIFDAPRDLVWDAFAKPEHLIQWMGPRHHPAVKYDADTRPGGKWRGCLRAADGSGDLWQGGEFREILPPERIVYTFQWDKRDEHDETFETLVTITFEDLGPRTQIRLSQTRFNTVSNRNGHGEGWNSGFDRLDDYLKRLRAGRQAAS